MNKIAKLLSAFIFLGFVFSCSPTEEAAKTSTFYQPWEELGQFFVDVQMAHIFPDSKTFVDCVPKASPSEILEKYNVAKAESGFNLKAFVEDNFEIPGSNAEESFETSKPIQEHLKSHWEYLTRSFDQNQAYSTLISLPNKYVVPGGRFREIYYWDSYFTMIGLAASERLDLVESMLDNFAYLIDTIGFIPNGNRTYYLGRSQPPYFASMVNLYTSASGKNENGLKYLEAIQKEYNFWMDGAEALTPNDPEGKRVVLHKGFILNRYWDNFDTPRPESYREDVELAEEFQNEKKVRLYRDLRAAAESGWDFSTRWFKYDSVFSSIRTTEILPVDLNCLIYSMEKTLSRLYNLKGETTKAQHYENKAQIRKKSINQFFWNEEKGTFEDILWEDGAFTNKITAASMYPFYFKVATDDKAESQFNFVRENLFVDGGLMTTKSQPGQQWDVPNGWAPLQWIAIKGFEHYESEDLANEIRYRWLAVNEKVYRNTGKMMEKYNVIDTTLIAGGGEYPAQDGFGWTNGVFLGLLDKVAKY